MRPAYPAELAYSQYPPPVPTAFVPPVINTFSTAVPPPKLSCYNCGAHGHQAQDCKEPTMEEITKQGQFRLDYSRYQKPPTPGECPMEK
uniref:CCHC-type domain-containing protein n=1 Tax=Timema douglasi TaxID=61478 RepID=A0A7R8VXT3_TIMDO|nr:unnamed protein product [Timema douglasi]